MASRRQLVAVNRMVEANDLDRGAYAVVIETAQGMARRVDAAGGLERAPMDVVKAYLSASKDLQRAVAAKAAAKPGRVAVESDPPVPEPSSPAKLHAVEESPLERIRRQKQAAS